MGIESISNESLDYHQHLVGIKRKIRTEAVAKSMFATAILVAGVAAILFLNGHFLAIGIGIILISSLAIYQYLSYYSNSKNIFSRASSEITQIMKYR